MKKRIKGNPINNDPLYQLFYCNGNSYTASAFNRKSSIMSVPVCINFLGIPHRTCHCISALPSAIIDCQAVIIYFHLRIFFTIIYKCRSQTADIPGSFKMQMDATIFHNKRFHCFISITQAAFPFYNSFHIRHRLFK